MLTKTKIALAAALILGTASAAFANDSGENHQDNDRSVVSGSVAKSANAGAIWFCRIAETNASCSTWAN
jgi:hypothetical protein